MLKVSGTVRFGEQKARMTHLYFRRTQTDEGPELALIFSDHPLPVRALDDRQKLADLARNRVFVGLGVQIDREGRVHSSDLFHDDGCFSGPWDFEPAAGNKANTAGRIATGEEREFFGTPYLVDVAFNAGAVVDDTWRGSPFYQTKPSGLATGRADGWMERQGRKTKLTHSLAVGEIDLFGESKERKLFLTAAPISDEMLTAPNGLEQALYKAGVGFMRIGLDAQNEVQSVMIPSSEGEPVNYTSNQWLIEFADGPTTDLDGRASNKGDQDTTGDFPRFAVNFHAVTRMIGSAVAVTGDNGKALPKDGGEPGKAFRNFHTALRKAKSLDELIPLRTAAMAAMIKDLPSDQRAPMLEFLQQEAQTSYTIVGGFANDTQATLWLEGKAGTERIDGRVNVHREDGSWKLGQEVFRIKSEGAP